MIIVAYYFASLSALDSLEGLESLEDLESLLRSSWYQ